MAILKIVAESLETGEQREFWFDNLSAEIFSDEPSTETALPEPVDLNEVGKQGPFSTIRLQLGLACNFSCEYCLQSTVARPLKETTAADIDGFMVKLAALPKQERFTVEFWGGEPFVYVKTMKPLAERIRAEYGDKVSFMVITNGSLITMELADWIDAMGFSLAISHDGPGQAVRGADPLVDNWEAINYLASLLLPKGRMSFSSVLNKQNKSRLAIIDFFKEKFAHIEAHTPNSEMGLIDVYHEGGSELLKLTAAEHFELRRNLWSELRFVARTRAHCFSQSSAIESIAIANREENYVPQMITQRCGMETQNRIAIDLLGNVITCQNTSVEETAANGESHKLGTVDNLDEVRIKSSMHWTQRQNCSTCTVLTLCKGSCMFLHGDTFAQSCEGSFTDKIGQFAVGFEQATGYVPVFIDNKHLPRHRQDIFGAHLDWSAEQDQEKLNAVPGRKVIPIVPAKA